jgi:hypothetical protein
MWELYPGAGLGQADVGIDLFEKDEGGRVREVTRREGDHPY